MFLSRFQDFIQHNALFANGDKILLAVSGGKDSVLMVHLFKMAGYSFGIAHCNFGLRGSESVRDEDFVLALADDLQVPYHTKHFDTVDYAQKKGISIQMAARELRYQYFEELRQAHQYQKIAIAQHQNDAIETVMLNLIRGTGISGLHGILPLRGDIIRPLLCFSGSEIEAIVTENDFSFVEDSSNASQKYMRNHIRLAIIPEMKKLNPVLEETFHKNITHFAQLEDFLNDEVKKIREEIFVHQGGLFSASIKAFKILKPIIIYELLKTFSFNGTTVNDFISVMDKHAGRQFFSTTHQLILDREHIFIQALTSTPKQEVKIGEEDSLIFFLANLFKQTLLPEMPENLKTPPNKIYVDAAKLIYPLTLRTWQQGDVFIPFGMKAFKKLSDFFIGEKLSILEKEKVPVLLNGNAEIIWICGLRSDNRYKVSLRTGKIIMLEMSIE